MRDSQFAAIQDAARSAITSAAARISVQTAVFATSDPGLSAGGLAAVAAIDTEVATIVAAAATIRTGAQFMADPPTGG